MTPVEFDLGMNKLMAEFPKGQAFTEGKRKLVYQAICHLPQFNFERIIKHFIVSARQLPTPKDIIDAARAEGIKHNLHEAGTVLQEVKCKWCCDGGVMEIHHRAFKKELFIRCNCIEGVLSFRTELPIWDIAFREVFDVIDMKNEGFKKWKPKAFDPKNPVDSIQDKVEMWNLKMKVSVIFWRETMGDPNDAA